MWNEGAKKLSVANFTLFLIEKTYYESSDLETIKEWDIILKWAKTAKASNVLKTKNYVFVCATVE